MNDSQVIALIVTACKVVDGKGSLDSCLALERRLSKEGVEARVLTIDPLKTDWHSDLALDHFRSGCGPIEALACAKELIETGQEQAVVISGEDFIRSEYSSAERQQQMAIYGEDYPLTQAYNDLAQHYADLHGLSADEFRSIAHQLFDNYTLRHAELVAEQRHDFDLTGDGWHKPVTDLFRGVDCANPVLDFQGRVLIVAGTLAEKLSIPSEEHVEVKGVCLGLLPEDGKPAISVIAEYQHLSDAFHQSCEQAEVDFAHHFKAGEALLEVYTCYPVVPMAFLQASGLVASLSEIPAFLKRHHVTVTGGMNLARAPWNNPALNSLIGMVDALRRGEQNLGVVHGNGGLGYRQGVAVLACAG